jgi:hypothetical protein
VLRRYEEAAHDVARKGLRAMVGLPVSTWLHNACAAERYLVKPPWKSSTSRPMTAARLLQIEKRSGAAHGG